MYIARYTRGTITEKSIRSESEELISLVNYISRNADFIKVWTLMTIIPTSSRSCSYLIIFGVVAKRQHFAFADLRPKAVRKGPTIIFVLQKEMVLRMR